MNEKQFVVVTTEHKGVFGGYGPDKPDENRCITLTETSNPNHCGKPVTPRSDSAGWCEVANFLGLLGEERGDEMYQTHWRFDTYRREYCVVRGYAYDESADEVKGTVLCSAGSEVEGNALCEALAVLESLAALDLSDEGLRDRALELRVRARCSIEELERECGE